MMVKNISNLVFEGGGVLGIAYLGVLDYLYRNNLTDNLKRTAGTSAGAIAACITSFGLPFEGVKAIGESLDYRKVPDRNGAAAIDILPEDDAGFAEPSLEDINCLYRLITRYGWYSSEYFYQWMKKVIADQFNTKKRPPYTFEDFKNPSLHKDSRPFLDLFLTGTNLTTGTSQVFSFDTTPTMEVAEAVRISMSIPLFFESAQMKQFAITGNNLTNFYCDGSVLNNYPIRLFDSEAFNSDPVRGANMETLGVRFMSRKQVFRINNLLDFIWSLVLTASRVQEEEYYSNPMDRIRSVSIDSLELSPIDFNVTPEDEAYQTLYSQGYLAAQAYFMS